VTHGTSQINRSDDHTSYIEHAAVAIVSHAGLHAPSCIKDGIRRGRCKW